MEQELRSGGPALPRPHSGSGGSICFSGAAALVDGPRIQQLLLHCAAALESKDVTLAQQAMWVLNNIVGSSQGDTPNSRLTSALLRGLVARACRTCVSPGSSAEAAAGPGRSRAGGNGISATELAEYVDLTPWHRFGFTASNGAILRAAAGRPALHVVDLSVTHCMQWPTLIDALSKRAGGPPALRISVPRARPAVPPLLAASDAALLGPRLANFAKSRGVRLDFHVIDVKNAELASVLSDREALELRDGEALVVNCHSWLRHVAPGRRDGLLDAVRALEPCLVTVTDEDADLDSPSLASRIAGCLEFHWILFDALDTCAPRDSTRRAEQEAALAQKIESVVAGDDGGGAAAERSECGARLSERMRRRGFDGVGFGEEVAAEVRRLLGEHANGWGVKTEEDMMVLTWKGHGAVFTTAWAPS
ncbi:scarecrow-like protein 32 [Brachypodium distachyon]|uniref:Uncharacterized protein n=1 Tax=Brachypodium distachyon TaxID=15368 RepID=I1HHY4_BRADI|nr:scarecrow-like protein 32 [Brachypodium distachyon]KQK05549.1 hypothetical protein BRADI_2g20760v3 [Brachypodium distachyon]|eukprot:XP_003566073.1 scarecrow-like protein 32 [Brachypodium distachyon]